MTSAPNVTKSGICHLVVLKFENGVRDDVVARLSPALDALIPQLDGLISYRHGDDLGINNGNADYGIAAVFETEEYWRAYSVLPAHRKVIDEIIAPNVKERTAVQFAVTP